jgi:hypothetical protein
MMQMSLEEIVSSYQRSKTPDPWIEFCKSQSGISEAIRSAALAKDERGKTHSHQRRIKNPGTTLEKFYENLTTRKDDILQAPDFEALLKIVEECRVKGVSEVCCYDTANRIGSYLGIFPQMIYLHAGSRVGAHRLLGTRVRSRSISVQDLPGALQNSSLTPGEIEDLLCIYKDKLGLVQQKAVTRNCCSPRQEVTPRSCSVA